MSRAWMMVIEERILFGERKPDGYYEPNLVVEEWIMVLLVNSWFDHLKEKQIVTCMGWVWFFGISRSWRLTVLKENGSRITFPAIHEPDKGSPMLLVYATGWNSWAKRIYIYTLTFFPKNDAWMNGKARQANSVTRPTNGGAQAESPWNRLIRHKGANTWRWAQWVSLWMSPNTHRIILIVHIIYIYHT